MPAPSKRYVRNRLLATLSTDDFASIHAHLESVPLLHKQSLVEPGRRLTHAYFVESGIVSVVAVTASGRQVEVGIIGAEGFVGVPLLLDAKSTPHHEFVQVEGEALRIRAAAFRETIEAHPTLRRLLTRFAHTFHVQTAHSALANGSHSLEERLARRLLMCHDRISGDEFPITHEFLSTMLGVRRAGVTTAIHVLEGAGMIKTRRSHIQVLDRDKLKAAAGESYGAPEREYARLIAPAG